MSIKPLLPVLCLCLIALTVTATRPPFQAVSKFDASKLIGVKWYELLYADNSISLLDACSRELYTYLGNGRIALQYATYEPGLNGELISHPHVIKQVGHSGTFKIVDENAPSGEYYYVLDYDRKNSEWIVFALDFEGEDLDAIVVITKPPQNVVAVQRAVDLAVKYGFNSHHLELQTSKCDYARIFKNFKKELKTLE